MLSDSIALVVRTTPMRPSLLLNGSTLKSSLTAVQLLRLFAMGELSLWPFSSSMLQRVQTLASVSSRESRANIHSVYCTNANALTLPKSVLTMQNTSVPWEPKTSWVHARCRITGQICSAMFPGSKLDSSASPPKLLWVRRRFGDAAIVYIFMFELWDMTFEYISRHDELHMNIVRSFEKDCRARSL